VIERASLVAHVFGYDKGLRQKLKIPVGRQFK